jgi:hypothetical protein
MIKDSIMEINTSVSYAQSPFRVQQIEATASANDQMLFNQQKKDQIAHEYFMNELAKHDKMIADQKNLSKLQEEKLKELSRILKKHHNLLHNEHFVDVWY